MGTDTYIKLKPGGALCLIDLGYNYLNHYGIFSGLDSAIRGVMACFGEKTELNSRACRKHYSSIICSCGFKPG